MPPKAAKAPKPVAFSVAHLQAGERSWTAGDSGPPVKLDLGGSENPLLVLAAGLLVERPRREVILLGKVLFGRQRFAFEVQELDYAPTCIQKLLDREKELDRERFGGSDNEEERGIDCPAWLRVGKARELAAKHSLQVKFEDIQHIEAKGGCLTLSLAKAPQCYLKPAGEGRIVNMEVCKDITNGAKTIVLTTAPPPSGGPPCRREPSEKVLGFPEVRELLLQHSPRLAALFRGLPPPLPVPVDATPRGKKHEAANNSQRARPSRSDLAKSATALSCSRSLQARARG